MINLLKSLFFPPSSPEEIARAMTEKIANSSFTLFRNEDFRRKNNFAAIDRVEQDRIFNEIVVSGIAIAILIFETLRDKSKSNRIDQFCQEMQIELESSYPNWLKELGSNPSDADLWKKLIRMRVEEYQNDYEKNKKSIKKTIDTAFPYVFVIAIGGSRHIARGKKKIMDEIFKSFLKWNMTLTEDMLKILDKSKFLNINKLGF